MNAVIETVNLTKYYGKARGIVDLNLTVTEGEVFGFIGPNGAGKSTTIRTLLSLIYKTSGEARIFGLDTVSATRSKSLKTSATCPARYSITITCARATCSSTPPVFITKIVRKK